MVVGDMNCGVRGCDWDVNLGDVNRLMSNYLVANV